VTPFTGHGGLLSAARRRWPTAPAPWIDLSTGINPTPYPAPRASRTDRARLPDPERTAALEAVAAAAFGIADPARVAAVPGAEAGLRLLPRLICGKSVWIDGPTYGGHASAWENHEASRAERAADADVAVVVTPNNPDGRITPAGDLLALADRLQARRTQAKRPYVGGGLLVVDESFADLDAPQSIAALGHPRIVALRSFGKAYGLAGVRLGFVLGPPDLLVRVRAAFGDWPVSADALAAGLKAYPDVGWRQRARTRLARSAAGLDAALRRAGFEIVGGTRLFRLARAEDAAARFQALGAAGILSRPFAYDPAWLRFGLPHPTAWRRVETALGALA
jgi:cobalamin biosynthetic protein CobC